MCSRRRLDHRRPDGEVGHEVAVHHVDVQQVGDLRDAIDLGAEPREVRRQDRRRQLHAEPSRTKRSLVPCEATGSWALTIAFHGAGCSRGIGVGALECEDEHAVGAGGLREEERAAAVRDPRRGGRRQRGEVGEVLGGPLVDVDGLLVRERAHRVHEHAARAHELGRRREQLALQRRQLGDRTRLQSPARVGSTAQEHAEAAARRVEQHPVERRP